MAKAKNGNLEVKFRGNKLGGNKASDTYFTSIALIVGLKGIDFVVENCTNVSRNIEDFSKFESYNPDGPVIKSTDYYHVWVKTGAKDKYADLNELIKKGELTEEFTVAFNPGL